MRNDVVMLQKMGKNKTSKAETARHSVARDLLQYR